MHGELLQVRSSCNFLKKCSSVVLHAPCLVISDRDYAARAHRAGEGRGVRPGGEVPCVAVGRPLAASVAHVGLAGGGGRHGAL